MNEQSVTLEDEIEIEICTNFALYNVYILCNDREREKERLTFSNRCLSNEKQIRR